MNDAKRRNAAADAASSHAVAADRHRDATLRAQPPRPDRQRRRIAGLVAAAPVAPLLAAPMVARAQDKPLTIVLTVPPGTSSDIIARLLAEQVRTRLRRSVVVESKSGGSGVVAVQHLRQMEADGSALLLAPSSAISLFPHFFSKAPFVAERDLVAVCEAAAAPHGITVNAAGPRTFDEWVASVKRTPALGSVGTPSGAGLASLLVYRLGRTLGIDVRTVAYRGGAPLLTDLLGGQIPASASILPDYLNEHRAGKLRILAQSMERRSTLIPDVPTFGELGVGNLVAVTSFGFFARQGTEPAQLAEFAAAFTEALGRREVVERLNGLGLEPVGGTPAQYQAKLAAETARWLPAIRETGMKLD